jgi:hypothetical protein
MVVLEAGELGWRRCDGLGHRAVSLEGGRHGMRRPLDGLEKIPVSA